MKLEPPWDRRRSPNADDQALPLINIAFLLLVFFLMAGTLIIPEPFSLDHLQVSQGETSKPVPQMLTMARDGRLAYRGEVIAQSDLSTTLFSDVKEPLSVKVDAQADANRVIDLLRHLRRVGVTKVRIIGVKPSAP